MSDNKAWIKGCMGRPERNIKNLSQIEIEHCAHRWLRIENACSAMGGFANFRYWVNLHAVNYFNSLKPLEGKIKLLEIKLAHVERELEEERRTVDFYAIEACDEGWCERYLPEQDSEVIDYLSGKRARQRQKERKEFNEHN